MIEKITNIKEQQIKNITDCALFELSKNDCEDIIDNIAFKLSNGQKMIIIKNINLSDKAFIEYARKIRQLCSIFSAILIIEKRADLAHIVDSDGLCLNEEDISLKCAKDIFSKDKLYAKLISNKEALNQEDISEFDFIITYSKLNSIFINTNKKIIFIEENK